MTNIDENRPGMCAHCGRTHPTTLFLCPCPERAAADRQRYEDYCKKSAELAAKQVTLTIHEIAKQVALPIYEIDKHDSA